MIIITNKMYYSTINRNLIMNLNRVLLLKLFNCITMVAIIIIIIIYDLLNIFKSFYYLIVRSFENMESNYHN